jgi:hypothetical protein
MLANASKQEDLRAEPAAPFLMKAHLTALIGGTSVGGEYSMNWSAQDRWREALILADFTRIREGAEGGYNQVPSLDLQPQIIFAIDQALDVHSLLRLSPTETVKKIHKRKIAGVELSCVSVYAKDVERRELCFDATSGLLIRLEVKNSSSGFDGLSSVDYSGFLTSEPGNFHRNWSSQGQASQQPLRSPKSTLSRRRSHLHALPLHRIRSSGETVATRSRQS